MVAKQLEMLAHSISLDEPRRRGGGSGGRWRGPRYIAPHQGQGASSVDMCCPSSPRLTASYLFRVGVVVALLAVLIAREADSRLPPKLLKVASGTGKALYARGYGYNVIPMPTKILLSANYARREVHGPRPPRRSKRPPRRNKRPPPGYAPKFQDYRPVMNRRPTHYPDPMDYYEQDQEEEYDYEDQLNKEYEDFVPKRSEQYNKGYTRRTKPKRYQDEITAYTENIGPIYVRKPPKSWRPSSKLYSAAIGSRPQRLREEQTDYEDYVDIGNYFPKKNRREKLQELERIRNRFKQIQESFKVDHPFFKQWAQVNLNPDNIYHDRNYDAKQDKFRREVAGANEKEIQQPARNTWFEKNRAPEEQENIQKWKINMDELLPRTVEESKWKILPDQNRWKDIEKPRRVNEQKRWNDPAPAREEVRGESNVEDEPDIITSQNAEAKTTEIPEYTDWVKEHSVGYGIEMESFDKMKKKKVSEREPDVVYGQAGYTKPRVPDIGYGHGLELIGGKIEPPRW